MKYFSALVGLACIFIIHTALGSPIEKEDEEEENDEEEYAEEENFEVMPESSSEVESRSCIGSHCTTHIGRPVYIGSHYHPVHIRPHIPQIECSARSCNVNVIRYINKRIVSLLNEYPKGSIDIKLDTLYNDHREILSKAIISKVTHLSNCAKSELEIKKFLEFVTKYKTLKIKILSALEHLKSITGDSCYCPEVQNEALTLSCQLKDVDSLHVAEELLEKFYTFQRKLQLKTTVLPKQEAAVLVQDLLKPDLANPWLNQNLNHLLQGLLHPPPKVVDYGDYYSGVADVLV